MGLLTSDFLFMESVFCEQLLFKSGFVNNSINNSIITLQILSLCVLQVKRELRIKCGCKIVTSCLQIFSWAKYGKISVAISANSFKRLTKLIIWISQTATILKIN
jgi:hypothetical protein